MLSNKGARGGVALIHAAVLMGLGTILVAAPSGVAQEEIQPPKLRLGELQANGWRHVRGEGGAGNQVITLSASSNLVDWRDIAILVASSFDFIDPAAPDAGRRFYRYSTVPYTGEYQDATGHWHYTNELKNQVSYPYDNFGTLKWDYTVDWVKFVIPLDEPTRVFYSTSRYPYHYDFATALLEPFAGMSSLRFDSVCLYNEGRRALLGSVLYPPPTIRGEFGIQFVGQDPLPRDLVRRYFELVSSTVTAPPGVRAFYIPTFDQYAAAEADRAYFASNGIPISTAERWASGDLCYSAGAALGRLNYVATPNIAAAYVAGQLLPTDILITDGVPAEMPYVAGLISLAPSTANSHAAILARSFGVPFIYLVNESDRARVLQWTNREIVLQAVLATTPWTSSRALVVAVDSGMTPETRAEILALKTPEPLDFTPLEHYGAYWADTENLTPTDMKYFGGKASNYGLLRRVLPTNSAVAIAFSFDLWNDFMEQPLAGGATLREEIRRRLHDFTYPPNMAALQTTLEGIRALIRQTARFTAAQEQVVTNALAGFDPRRKLRFRSSTNLEDADSYSGAGLYDSYSGCLLDDLDTDHRGPCACDPAEPEERGVFRAIRRVYASFYNDNAVLERLRHSVDESRVGMALLVHYSSPDDIERANGVATFTYTRNPTWCNYDGTLVTQLGAVSVANPDGTALPEEVGITVYNLDELHFIVPRYSSLLPLGVNVLDYPADYDALTRMIVQVTDAYAQLFPDKKRFVLDLEYKKLDPGWLDFKQVREVPQPPNTNIPPYLLNEPVTFVPFQGLYGDLWAAHRLKSRWTLNTRTMSLTDSNLAAGLFTDATIEHLDGTNVRTLSGPVVSFPLARHDYDEGASIDHWVMGTRDGPAEFALRVFELSDTVSAQHPFKTIRELKPGIEAVFQQPVRSLKNEYNWTPELRLETNVSLRLIREVAETSRDLYRHYTFRVSGQGASLFIATSFWLSGDRVYDDRPALIRFEETTITGLTSEPIRLRGYWSQTFNSTHAYGTMCFLFEPRLETSVTAAQRAELAAADIAAIYLHANGYKDFREEQDSDVDGCYVLKLVGFDGTIRQFSDCDFTYQP